MSKKKAANRVKSRPLGPNEQELEFAEFYARLGSGAESARLAGYPKNHPQVGAKLRVRPDIAEAIEKARKKIEKDVSKKAEVMLEERRVFLHRELIHRLRRAKTHYMRGDADIAKLIEIGFKSTKDIAPNQVSQTNTNQAAALAASAPSLPHFFQSAWRKAALEAQTFVSNDQLQPEVGPGESGARELPQK